MKSYEIIAEAPVAIDNEIGIGQTPNNQNVGYMGFTVKMKPSMFLKLVSFEPEHISKRNSEYIKKHINAGKSIGAPHLYIEFPNSWFDEWNPYNNQPPQEKVDLFNVPIVVGHEGRHRMNAIGEIFGDEPVETHLFLQTDKYELKGRGKRMELLLAAQKLLKAQGQNAMIYSNKAQPIFSI